MLFLLDQIKFIIYVVSIPQYCHYYQVHVSIMFMMIIINEILIQVIQAFTQFPTIYIIINTTFIFHPEILTINIIFLLSFI